MMYGVVLLMAVTAGGESADLGRRGGRGCCGCCGYVASCYGCYGCRGGCCGYGYGCGGYSGYSCCGYVPASSCGGYAPSYGCGGYAPSYGCGGGVPVAGAGSHAAAETLNAARVVVTLPADAKLTIDGRATASTSSVRTFETPSLEAGKKYSYQLEATFRQDGKPVVVSKSIVIEAGKTTTIDLSEAPTTGVARK